MSSTSENENLQLRLQKYTLLSGIILMLTGCFEGPLVATMANKNMGKSTHHQMAHNAELLIGLSFAFPFCNLSRKLLWLTFYLLQIGTWANCLSYLVIAVTDCPNPLFENSPELVSPGNGDNNIYTKISTVGLLGLTSVGMLLSLILLIVGVVNSEVKAKRH